MSDKMRRKDFLQTVVGVAVAASLPGLSAAESQKPGMKLGVTLYSYTGDFGVGTMSLEDCIADVADFGGEGIEILGETHVPDFPNPSERWIEQWRGWMEKYKTRPSCYDSFVDTLLRKDRPLSLQESLNMMERDFKLASRMGFKIIRPTYPQGGDSGDERYQARIGASQKLADSYAAMIEKALPLAEKYDLTIAVEMHSPMLLKSRWVDAIMDVIARTKTKHLGFTLDMSLFTKTPPRYREEELLAGGARKNILDYIRKAYEDHLGPEKTVAEVKRMGGSAAEIAWASGPGAYHFSWNDPKDLQGLIAHIHHIHGKFWEMKDDLTEYSIPHKDVVPVLVKGGFSGYFSSEYEGPRELFAASDQLRQHHAMLRGIMLSA
jgi:sugar phosphate isomerase/epimerase